MAGLDPSPPGRNITALRRPQRIGPLVAPARFAVGRIRGICLIGRAGRPLARSIWVFLDHRGFTPHGPKTRLGFPWISLDFLVRIENFKWVTPDFWREKISRALLPLDSALGQEPVFLRCRTQCRSSSKPNSFSAFLQSIADDRNVDSFSSRGRGVSDFTQSPT
jgi:hypothetical protein